MQLRHPTASREVATLLTLLESPERPFVAVTGGAKVKDKLGIMKVLAAKADLVIVGGGMAYTFRVAEGHTIKCHLPAETLAAMEPVFS